MIEGLVGAFLQVGVVLIVCLVAWLIFGRRKASFRVWLGLTGAPPLLFLVCLVLGAAGAWLLLQAPGVATLASGPGTVIAASTPMESPPGPSSCWRSAPCSRPPSPRSCCFAA